MSVDLMSHFKHSAEMVGNKPSAPPRKQETEVEMGSKGGLNEFYDLVVRANQSIKRMKAMTDELNRTHNDVHKSTDDAQKKELREKANDLQTQITGESKQVKEDLDAMQALTEQRRQGDEHPSEIRIQENQHMLIRKDFIEALTAFQTVEQNNKDKYKETIKRRIKTKFQAEGQPVLDDDSADRLAQEVIEKGRESSIFSDSRMTTAITTLEEICETREDIHKIRVAMAELFQIFKHMEVLVMEQGEMLNDIRSNVNRATEYVVKGRMETRKAQDYAKKSRKKMMWILICIVIIVVVAVLMGVVVLK